MKRYKRPFCDYDGFMAGCLNIAYRMFIFGEIQSNEIEPIAEQVYAMIKKLA